MWFHLMKWFLQINKQDSNREKKNMDTNCQFLVNI